MNLEKLRKERGEYITNAIKEADRIYIKELENLVIEYESKNKKPKDDKKPYTGKKRGRKPKKVTEKDVDNFINKLDGKEK